MASLSLAFDILARDRASKVFRDVGNAADDTGKKGSKLGGVMGGVMRTGAMAAATAAAAAGTAVVAFGAASIKAASNGQQSMGAVEAVFGKAADAVKAFSEDSAMRLGLSQNSYRELAAVVGSQLQAMGKSQAEAAVESDKLLTIGADLAATFGGSVKDSVAAVGSLLRGERDPIERYGVAIKEADINARLAALGQNKLEGAALKTAKANATLSLLTEQTKNSMGRFGAESDTLAGKQERLRAKFEDVKEQMGKALLPAVTALTGKVLDLVTGFQKGTGAGGDLRAGMEKVKKAFEDNRPQIEAVLKAVAALAEFWLLTYLPAVVKIVAYTTGAMVDGFRALVRVVGEIQMAFLGMLGSFLSGLGSIFNALAKVPGPFQDNFKAAAIAVGVAKSSVDGLKVAVDIATRPKTLKVNSDVRGESDVRSLGNEVARLKSKQITITTVHEAVYRARNDGVGGGIQARALGGPVTAGRPYLVGERGPELILPRANGQVLNANETQQALGGGDSAVVAAIEALRADLRALPRGYMLGQRQMAGI